MLVITFLFMQGKVSNFGNVLLKLVFKMLPFQNFEFLGFALHNSYFSKYDIISDNFPQVYLRSKTFVLRFLLRFGFQQERIKPGE